MIRKRQPLFMILILSLIFPVLPLFAEDDFVFDDGSMTVNAAQNQATLAINKAVDYLEKNPGSWEKIIQNQTIPSYNFDTISSDFVGAHRIKFKVDHEDVLVFAEGKSFVKNDRASLRARIKKRTIPCAVMTPGNYSTSVLNVHWGPLCSQGNITLTDTTSAQNYFPRKFAKGVVQSSVPGYERDTNGLEKPNTDHTEWWSNYRVPKIPVLDFAVLRTSAANTGTLNVYGCSKMTSGVVGAPWWGRGSCQRPGANHNGMKHTQDLHLHPLSKKGLVWYWDDNVTFTGPQGVGIYGHVLVRGNLTQDTRDGYVYSGHVPKQAWKEYSKISKSFGDTSQINEYPADNGLQQNLSTFNFGGQSWQGGPMPANTDIGIRGLVYVGGNFDLNAPLDIHGAVMVQGALARAAGSESSEVYFDDTLHLPIQPTLLLDSLESVDPDSQPWVSASPIPTPSSSPLYKK